jgi:protein phosphatase
MKYSFEIAGLTDTGKNRPNNEDSIGFDMLDDGRLFAMVADGMGGHRAGEIASNITVTELQQSLCDSQWDESRLISTIQQINLSIYKQAQQNNKYQGMGTTLVLACIENDSLLIAHVGDSRCYQWLERSTDNSASKDSNNVFKALTTDHSLVEEMLSQGLIEQQDLAKSMRKNLLTRALGVRPGIEVTLGEFTLENSGIILLCSDGLSDMLDDQQLENILSTPMSLGFKCQNLIDEANKAGGRDNISVVLISYS